MEGGTFDDSLYGEQPYHDQQQQQQQQQQQEAYSDAQPPPPPPQQHHQHDGTNSASGYEGADFNPNKFFGAFWIEDDKHSQNHGWERLRAYQTTGNSYLKDVSAIFKERAAIEEHYARSLQKLQAKAQRIDEFTEGSLRDGWSRVIQEHDDMAQWHLKIADMFKQRLCESLLTFEKKLKKDQKAKAQPVEKAFANYNDAIAYKNKCLKAAFGKTRDIEAAEAAVDEMRDNPAKKATPKEVAKGEKAIAKAVDHAKSADETFKHSLTKLQEAREDWEQAMITGCNDLEELEFQRTTILKQVFHDISSTLSSLVPEMKQAYDECITTAQNIANEEVVAKICENRGTGKYTSQQVLYCSYEENLEAPMSPQRRQVWLTRRLNNWKEHIKQAHGTRTGLLRLLDASMGVQEERNTSMNSVNAVKRKLIAHDYALAAAHATAGKYRCLINENKGVPPPNFSLRPYLYHYVDKHSLSHSVLRLPVGYVVDAQMLLNEEEQMAASDDQYGGHAIQVVSTPSVATHVNVGQSMPPPSQPPPQHPGHFQQQQQQQQDDDFSDDDDFDDDDDDFTQAQPTPQQFNAYGNQPMQQRPQQPLPTSAVPQQSTPTSVVPPPPPPLPQQQQQQQQQQQTEQQCRALYDYVANEADEMSISAGDVLTVLDTSDAEWWEAMSPNGQRGLIPSTYVQMM